MTESRASHVYRREIRAGERTSLSVLAGLVPPGSRVLDLGTGSGALGALLAASKGCTVDGVTLSEEEAALARAAYRRVEVADLEDPAWAATFAGERYDCIVCADVLEHLRQPERTLALARELLAPAGELLVSIPNAGYAGLVAELMHGDFRYRDEGLLDRTHLRFFTRRSLHAFLAAQGWRIAHLEAIARPLHESEFQLPFDRLPPAVARYLVTLPDAGVYQFIVRAAPGEPDAAVPTGGGADAQALFTAQLYVAQGGDYAEDRKLTVPGRIGDARQRLAFDLPAGVTRLRLDPADRPGFQHLHALRLLAGDAVAWEWRADRDGVPPLQAARHQQMVLQPPWPGGGVLVLLTGDDPWIELPIPAAAYVAVAGAQARFEAELGWPMSADYLALAGPAQSELLRLQRDLQPLQDRLAQEEARLRESQAAWLLAEQQRRAAEDRLHHLGGEAAHLRASVTGLQEELGRTVAHRDELLAETRRAGELIGARDRELGEARDRELALAGEAATLRQRNTDLAAETRRLAHEKLTAESALRRTQGEFAQLAQHLRWIENSTVFRATRPLVRAKMAFDRLRRGQPAAAPSSPAPAPAQPIATTVDVVVPVYRGIEDTRRCIESVLRSRCATPWRMVVLNDASPEPEVTAYLREVAQRDGRITLLENPQNLGFVGTVNRGMAVSDAHDVVLLNSDAEVANDWLDRLRRAAYHDARVASVTPFSNNATICSYPKFCEANELPPGCDTAALDDAFARANAGQVVDVPTGVGFCMYIRRDCLREVGLFDVEEFGKGYGEENDFCRRAADAGWRNLHALDTFVRHAGGVSFGASKSQREIEAVEKLRRLHPTYDRLVHEYVQADPPRLARLRADLVRARCGGRPVVLSVTHDREGGTLRHVHELAAQLARQATFFVLSPAPGGQVRLALAEPGSGLQWRFAVEGEWHRLLDTLRELGVAHVHYHHLAGHHPVVAELGTQLGLAWDFTAHDYHALCPHISLTDAADRYCGEDGTGDCRRCEPAAAPAGGLDAWREGHGRLLTQARYVLVPSADTARRLRRMWPQARVRVAPHGDLADGVPPVQPVAARPASEPLRIVVLGALSRIKGADVLEDVASQAARAGLPLDFHLLGFAYRDLKTRPRCNLTVHGAYQESDLPRLLADLQPDVVWFPALWPETYSYTLSAALAAGLPVVASDLGAFAGRLDGRAWSWVRPWDTAASQWAAFFDEIRLAHFVPATPPAKQWQLAPAATEPAWDYASAYLAGLSAPAPLADVQPLLALAEQPAVAAAQPVPAAAGARQKALGALVWLRSLPVLRPIARAVPMHWQRRVKTWLMA